MTAKSTNITWHHGFLARDARWQALGHAGATVWLTGLPGSGKSTIATTVEARLVESTRSAYVLDGDNLRHGLTADLGFSQEDREANVARVAEVARLFADAGTVSLVSLVSPFRSGRERARRLHQEAGLPFYEVWVDTPLELCERRDPKGLYARARRGEISGFTGVDAAYEPPDRADLIVPTASMSVEDAATAVIKLLAT